MIIKEKPAAPSATTPSDNKLEEIFHQYAKCLGGTSCVDLKGFREAARAVLDEIQPQPPTQRQLIMLASLYFPDEDGLLPFVSFARAVLLRWGQR